MKITVSIKHVYGKQMVYPADDQAKLFARLTGHKTFSQSDLSVITDLGYSIEVETPTL